LGRILVPEALAKAGYEVKRHDDLFPQKTADPLWLAEVGRRGWLALSRNKSIRYVRIERDAVMLSGVAFFIVLAKGLSGYQVAEMLAATIPAIIRFRERHAPPFIAKVHRPTPGQSSGRVEMSLTLAEWEKSRRL
jgi:hypothetical protein